MRRYTFLASLGLSLALLAGCNTAPPTASEKSLLEDKADYTLRIMERQDPGLPAFLKDAYGYAVFPSVGKGGLIAGGTYGRGVLYEDGAIAGYVDISQATVGGQIGGQTFTELVVLEDQYAMDRFKSGKVTFETSLSAVALDRGTAERAKYRNGVIAFVKPQGGLMAEAVIGGQQFTVLPRE